MKDIGFTIARFLIPPAAVVMLVNWLTMPSVLSQERSIQTSAVVTTAPGRGEPAAYPLTEGTGQVRFTCQNALALCTSSIRDRNVPIRVWIQHTGFLGEAWVVAAEREGNHLATPSQQNDLYAVHKRVWAVGVSL